MTLPGHPAIWRVPALLILGGAIGVLAGLAYGVVDAVIRGHPGYVPLSVLLFLGLGISAGILVGVMGTIAAVLPLPRSNRWWQLAADLLAAIVAGALWEIVILRSQPLTQPWPWLITAGLGFAGLITVGLLSRRSEIRSHKGTSE